MYHLIKKVEDDIYSVCIIEETKTSNLFVFGRMVEWILRKSTNGSPTEIGSIIEYYHRRIIFSSDNLEEVREQAMLEVL